LPERAIRVIGTPEFMTFHNGFLVGSSERIMIDNGLNSLKENIASGEKIQRTQWPPLYVKRDSVKNLYKMNLSKQGRLIYTIFSDGGGYSVLVLEVFLSHKSYNKRFGYS